MPVNANTGKPAAQDVVSPISAACADCGGETRCTGDASCWCMAKPRTEPVPAMGACRCERCLERKMRALKSRTSDELADH